MSSFDYIPDTSLKLKQDKRYRMTSDTIHLARFMDIRKQDVVLDVGTNNGVLALVASQKTNQDCFGIDIDESSIHLAQYNAELNSMKRLHFETCSLQEYQCLPLDVIVCNPPYFNEQNVGSNPMEFDSHLSLEELAYHAFRLLKDKGRIYIIIKSTRLIETMEVFIRNKLQIKRIQSIHHTKGHPASSVCIEATKNGRSMVRIEAPVIQKESLE